MHGQQRTIGNQLSRAWNVSIAASGGVCVCVHLKTIAACTIQYCLPVVTLELPASCSSPGTELITVKVPDDRAAMPLKPDTSQHHVETHDQFQQCIALAKACMMMMAAC